MTGVVPRGDHTGRGEATRVGLGWRTNARPGPQPFHYRQCGWARSAPRSGVLFRFGADRAGWFVAVLRRCRPDLGVGRRLTPSPGKPVTAIVRHPDRIGRELWTGGG